MEQYFIYALTFLYSIAGLITFAGFFPTMTDLWKGKPSANVNTYVIWTATAFITSLYALFIVRDLIFSLVASLQLMACLIVLVLMLRLKIRRK